MHPGLSVPTPAPLHRRGRRKQRGTGPAPASVFPIAPPQREHSRAGWAGQREHRTPLSLLPLRVEGLVYIYAASAAAGARGWGLEETAHVQRGVFDRHYHGGVDGGGGEVGGSLRRDGLYRRGGRWR